LKAEIFVGYGVVVVVAVVVAVNVVVVAWGRETGAPFTVLTVTIAVPGIYIPET
jgi:hypothetical protein